MTPQSFDGPTLCVNPPIQNKFPVRSVKRGTAPGQCWPWMAESPSCGCARHELLSAQAPAELWLGKSPLSSLCCWSTHGGAELLQNPADLSLIQPCRTLHCPSTEPQSFTCSCQSLCPAEAQSHCPGEQRLCPPACMREECALC